MMLSGSLVKISNIWDAYLYDRILSLSGSADTCGMLFHKPALLCFIVQVVHGSQGVRRARCTQRLTKTDISYVDQSKRRRAELTSRFREQTRRREDSDAYPLTTQDVSFRSQSALWTKSTHCQAFD